MSVAEARKMPSVRLESASEDKLYTVGRVGHNQSYFVFLILCHIFIIFLFQSSFSPYFPGHIFHLIYCPAMVDPDAPSRKNPRAAQWLHWIVINVDGD